jgi:hypothetical protein
MISVLGSHLAAALVGIGMTVVVFACIRVAAHLNERAASSRPLAAFGWSSARFILGLVSAAAIALSWLYLLLDARVSVTEAACLLASAVVSAYLFFKHRVFGQFTVLRW